MIPLSTMTLDELLRYTEVNEHLIKPLEEFQADYDNVQALNDEQTDTINKLENELENYKNFVSSMYRAMHEQTRCKDLKQAINEELDFYSIEL